MHTTALRPQRATRTPDGQTPPRQRIRHADVDAYLTERLARATRDGDDVAAAMLADIRADLTTPTFADHVDQALAAVNP